MSASKEHAPNSHYMRTVKVEFAEGVTIELNPIQKSVLDLLDKSPAIHADVMEVVKQALNAEERVVKPESLHGRTSNIIYELNTKLTPVSWHIIAEKKKGEGEKPLTTYTLVKPEVNPKPEAPPTPHPTTTPPDFPVFTAPPPYKGKEEMEDPNKAWKIPINKRHQKLLDNPEDILPSDRSCVLFVLSKKPGEPFTPHDLVNSFKQSRSDRPNIDYLLTVLKRHDIRIRTIQNPDGSISFERPFF